MLRHNARAAAVERLAARLEIADVLARFCERIDEYDIDSVMQLFTPDCITDDGPGRGGEIRGRDALRQRMLESQGTFPTAHHQPGHVLGIPRYRGVRLQLPHFAPDFRGIGMELGDPSPTFCCKWKTTGLKECVTKRRSLSERAVTRVALVSDGGDSL
jgi:hypothetical protein